MLSITFITQHVPIPGIRLYGTIVRPSRLTARRRLQGTLGKGLIASCNPKSGLLTIQETIDSLHTLFPSGAPTGLNSIFLPSCSTNPVFTDVFNIIVCDAVISINISSLSQFTDGQEKWDITNPGVEFWLFAVACALGDLNFIQQTHAVLAIKQKDMIVRRLLAISIKNNWETAFHFLLGQGYNVNEYRPPLLRPTPFSRLLRAVLSPRIVYLETLLTPRYGLYRCGHHHQAAFRMVRKHQKSSAMRERMLHLLTLNGDGL